MQYVHMPEGSDAHALNGVQAHWDERTLRHGGRDVLYLLTDAVVDTVCCGDRVFHYATVVGYITELRGHKTEAGLDISTVEPVADAAARKEIEGLLTQQDPDLQVSFRSE
ncbi:MAG: hypothetical protein JXA58_03265 [Dehalococcoidia bacterium]|nr:hypothetical protein [Dehalococcoidia bacterium]